MRDDQSNPEKRTPIHCWTDAEQYIEAGEKLSENITFCNPPVYFCLTTAIELIFKAYLAAKGITDKDLRELGHSLENLMQKAIGLKLLDFYIISDNEKSYIKILNDYHLARSFVYSSDHDRILPGADRLLKMNKKMLAAIKPVCIASANKK